MSEGDDPITLVELLSDEEIEFVIFNDGEELLTFDSYGAALDTLVDHVGLEIGVVQAVEGGASRPVYLSAEGAFETLLAEREPDDGYTVDIRFTGEGLSASAYGADAAVVDEAWYTWAEIEDLKSDAESHITFELPIRRGEAAEVVDDE